MHFIFRNPQNEELTLDIEQKIRHTIASYCGAAFHDSI